MFAAQDPGGLMWIILIIVATVAAFWRTVIKLVITGVVALAVLGFIYALQGFH